MKRILVFISIAMFIVLAGAGTATVAKNFKSDPNVSPSWFNVQAADMKLWVANNGLYGGWYQDNSKGLLFRIATPREPDHKSGQYALHSNPTNDGGYYGNLWAGNWAAMPAGVPIPAGSSASVAYWAHWNLELNCDGVELQIATSQDNYSTWTGLHPTGTVQVNPASPPLLANHWYYTGIYGDYGIWDQQWTCDLTPYIGKTIKLRFAIYTDGENVSTGFFVDDLTILANGNIIATYGFESGPNMWVTDPAQYWGRTVQSLWTENLLFQGEILAGVSASYVANVMASDWQPFGADYGPPLHLRQTTRWTAPADQPKFDLDTYFYAPSGSGGGRYIIADCYLKHVDDEDFSDLYIGLHMEPMVSIPWYDYTQYDNIRKMIWLNYNGHPELTCMGMMYLAPNTGDPYAAQVCDWTQPFWGQDANLYNTMAQQQYDITPYYGKSFAIISKGPFSGGQIPKCHTKRFTFAFVAGDDSNDLIENATACRGWYDANLADSPMIPENPVKVAPVSLGNIKALYK